MAPSPSLPLDLRYTVKKYALNHVFVPRLPHDHPRPTVSLSMISDAVYLNDTIGSPAPHTSNPFPPSLPSLFPNPNIPAPTTGTLPNVPPSLLKGLRLAGRP